MADAVDNRIVEMQFNNKDFEKNISVSQKSLEKFKKELNFGETSKGLDDFSKSMKAVDFSVMDNNIQKLTDKFTGLGNAGEFVLSRIRRTLEGLGDKVISFANSLTTVQTKAGFVKYESLNKSVQTLRSATGKEEKEIYAVLKRLTEYTDQTSYDFAQGVTSISQLVSSGAATLSKAETVVEGFYNYAAKAGADTAKASHALEYSMVQALQRGFLDWGNAKELNRQSLLTKDFKEQLLQTAVELGTVTKEGDKYYAVSKKSTKQKKVEVNTTNLFNDSLQHQWATTKVLNATLAKYADTNTDFGSQAYAAAQRCTTFTDALNAWKDMISTGWMTTYRTVFGDLTDAMSLFSAVCEKVSDALEGLIEARNKILDAWKNMGGRDSLMGMLFGEIEDPDGKVLFKGAYGILDIITEAGNIVSEGWWNMVKNLMPKNEQQALLDWVNNNIQALNAQLIKQGQEDLVITKPFESFEEFWNSDFAKGTGLREGAFGGGLAEATKNVQAFVASIQEWLNEPLDEKGSTRLARIQAVIDAIINTISFGFQIIGGLFDFFGAIGDQLGDSFDAIGEFLATLAGGIEEGEVAASNGGKIRQFFTSLAETLRPITSAINAVITSFFGLLTAIFQNEDAAEGMMTVWEKIKSVLSSVWNVITGLLGPIAGFISTVFDQLAVLFTDGFTEENVELFKNNILTAFDTMWNGIKTALEPIYNKIKTFMTELWATVTTAISGYFADENSFGYKAVQWIKQTVEKLKNGLNQLFPGATDAIGGFFSNIVTTIKGWIDRGELFKGIKKSGKQFVEKFTNLFKDGFFEGFKKIGTAIAEVFKGLFVGEVIDEKTGEAMNFLESLGAMLTRPGSLGEGFLKLFNRLREWWSALDSETKAFLVVGLGVAVVIKKTVKVVQSISENFNELVKTIKGGIVQSPKKTFAEKFLMIAGAFAIMTASIYTLANMDLWKGIQGLAFAAVILTGIVIFMRVMKNVVKEMTVGDAVKLAVGVIGIATAIGRIVDALLPVAKLKLDEIGNMGTILAYIVGALGILMAAAKYSNFSWGSGGGILLFAISLGVIIKQMEKLLVYNNPEKFGELEFMAKAFGQIILLLMGLGRAMKKASNGLFGAASLAAAIAVLIFSLKQIVDLEWEELGKMGAVLAVSLGLMYAFIWAMGRLKNNKGLKDSDLWQLIGLAAGIAALILALKQVADLGGDGNWEPLAKMGATFGVVILGLIGLIAAVNKFEGKGGRGLNKSGLSSIIGLALGIASLILVLQMVSGLKWEELGKMGVVFGAVIIGLIGLISTIGKSATENGRGFKGAGMITGMIAIVLGIAGLIKILSQTASMPSGDIAKMLITYAVIIKGINSVIRVIGESAREGGSGFKGAAMLVGMFALVRGIGGLIHYMKPLTQMKWGDLAKLWISMIIIFRGITNFIACVPKDMGFKYSVGVILSIVSLVGGIWALIEVLKPLAGMAWGDLGKIGLGLIILTNVMTNALWSLTNMTQEQSKSEWSDVLKTLVLMAGMCVVMVGMTHSLRKLKDVKFGTIIAFSLGLSAMMLAMAKASQLSQNVGIKGVLLAIVALAGGMAAVLGVIGLIGPWVLESIGASLIPFGEGIKAVGEALKSFGEATSGLSESNISAAVSALKGIARVQFTLTAENISLALFSKFTGKDIKKGDLKLFGEDLATIGGFVADFADAIKDSDFSNVDKAVSALEGMAKVQGMLNEQAISLAVWETIINLFSENPVEIDPTTLEEFAGELVKVAPMLAKVGDALAASKSDFKHFETASDALKAMISAQGALNEQAIALTVWETIANIFSEEPVTINPTTLEEFAEQLINVAPALGKVGVELDKAHSDFKHFETASAALKAMVSAQGALNEQAIALTVWEQIASAFSGKPVKIDPTTLDEFADQLINVAPALGKIGTSLQDVEFGNTEKAAQALKAFAEVQKTLSDAAVQEGLTTAVLKFFNVKDPETGKDMVATAEDIEDFGNHLEPLGQAIAKFAKAVSYVDFGEGKIGSINTEGFSAAVDAVTVFGDLQDVLNRAISGGLFSFLTGEGEKLPEFSSGLISLGGGIRSMYDAIFALNENGKAPSAADLEYIAKLVLGLSNIFNTVKTYGTQFPELNIQGLVTGIRDILGLCDQKNIDEVSKMTTLIQSIADAYGTMHLLKSSTNSLYDSLELILLDTATQDKLKATGESLSEMLSEGISDSTSTQFIIKAMRKLASGMKNITMFDLMSDTLTLDNMLFENLGEDVNDISDIVGTMTDLIQDAGEDKEWSFHDVGFYLAAGIAAGITNGTYLVEIACRNLINAGKEAAMDEADESSPSRVFKMIGGYMSEGAAEGIANGGDEVGDAAREMVDSAVKGFQDGTPTVTKSFLEWYIEQQGDSALNAIINEDARLKAALDEFNTLPGIGQDSWLSQWAQSQKTDGTTISKMTKEQEKELEAQKNNQSVLGKAFEAVWNEKFGPKKIQSLPKAVASAIVSPDIMKFGAMAAAPVIGNLLANKNHKEFNNKYVVPAALSTIKWLNGLNKQVTELKKESIIFLANELYSPKATEETAEKAQKKAGKSYFNLMGDVLSDYFETKTGITLPSAEDNPLFAFLTNLFGNDQNNPISVLAKEAGINMSKETASGMAEGAADSMSELEAALNVAAALLIPSAKAEEAAEEAGFESVASFVSAFTNGLNSEGEPTVAPIVDMTNVEAAASEMDTLFGPRTTELSADGYRYARENIPRSDRTTSDYTGPDLNWLKGSVAELEARIGSVATAVSNMQIVLDSGAIAGAVTDGVNKSLGAKTNYRRRRN